MPLRAEGGSAEEVEEEEDVGGSEVDVDGYCCCSGAVCNGKTFALEVKGDHVVEE